MNSRRRPPRGEPILRTVERCEAYLDRLALVVERAGSNAAAFLPIIRRLERELAEARAEQDLLERLRQRRLKPVPAATSPAPSPTERNSS